MKFQEFPSIENPKTGWLKKIVSAGYAGEAKWVVEEKVHGANFSFWTDGQSILPAKRSGFIKEDETFYGYRPVFEGYQRSALIAFEQVALTQRPGLKVESIAIFGELFGGHYPHPQVTSTYTGKPVQQGVWYSPELQFVAFDILVNAANSAGEETHFFLPPDKAKEIAGEGGFYALAPLFEGTLEECLQYPNKFRTTIPGLWGLPPIENNFCEGVVLKPTIPGWALGGGRVVIKNKHERFSEARSLPCLDLKAALGPTVGHEGQVVFEALSCLICENRLNNVISKVGPEEGTSKKKLISLLIRDVLKEGEELGLSALPEEEQARIQKAIGAEAAAFVRGLK